MIKPITQEEVLIHWQDIEDSFSRFWEVGVNFDTLSNLKRRLLAQELRLWAWQNEKRSAKLLFVTEAKYTAKAKILCLTHFAGFNRSGKRYTRTDLREMISTLFEEVEDLALTLYFDAVSIHARPAHVKLAQGYTKMCQPIVKQLTNIKRGTQYGWWR